MAKAPGLKPRPVLTEPTCVGWEPAQAGCVASDRGFNPGRGSQTPLWLFLDENPVLAVEGRTEDGDTAEGTLTRGLDGVHHVLGDEQHVPGLQGVGLLADAHRAGAALHENDLLVRAVE